MFFRGLNKLKIDINSKFALTINSKVLHCSNHHFAIRLIVIEMLSATSTINEVLDWAFHKITEAFIISLTKN